MFYTLYLTVMTFYPSQYFIEKIPSPDFEACRQMAQAYREQMNDNNTEIFTQCLED